MLRMPPRNAPCARRRVTPTAMYPLYACMILVAYPPMARSTAKVLQCGVDAAMKMARRADASTTIMKGTGDRNYRTDHRESTEHLVVD